VTFRGLIRWINQFDERDRKHVCALLECVIYLSEQDIRQILIDQNRALMARLAAAGLPPEKLIYVQVDDAGSSSPVMLNMLRDAAGWLLPSRFARLLGHQQNH
jgi:Mg2+/Co2+ transporter CorC